VISVNLPMSSQDVMKLRAGDRLLLNGRVLTARDRAHRFLLEEFFEKMKEATVYHCGPIIKGSDVIAAGPTTSMRMSPYTPELIERYGIRAIIGKGGMDDKVLKAIRGKAVYLSAIGGAAVTYAKSMMLRGVYKEEFGMPEAIWEFEVKDFPVIVTMDAHGRSLHREVMEASRAEMNKLLY